MNKCEKTAENILLHAPKGADGYHVIMKKHKEGTKAMNHIWSAPRFSFIRLLQCAAVICCLGLLCVESFYFPILWEEQSATALSQVQTEAQALEDAGNEEFHIIEGSLPIDGDYQSALLTVLGARPLYSTTISEDVASVSVSAKPVMDWSHLERDLNTLTESYAGTWAVYVKDLATEDTLSINDQSMEAASLIKLYIMGAVMEQIQEGQLEESDRIDDLLSEMITVSDNEASNELVRYLDENHDHKSGIEQVNRFIQEHGFENTVQLNGLEDTSLWYSSQVNQTSVGDCGRLLEEIYQGTLVSHLASRKMETLLMGQDITYKIPAALPDEAVSASKTGEVSGTENDTAIVYSKGGDFILCIMSTDWSSQNEAVEHIHEITKKVYTYFNPEPSKVTIREIED